MSKKEQLKIKLDAPSNGFPHNHYFNRFRIEKMTDGVLVHLGFLGSDTIIMGLFSFFIPKQDILQQKESILYYLDSLDYTDEKSLAPLPIFLNERAVHSVRFIHAGRTGSHTELLLYNIPVFQQFSIASTKDTKLIADPLAALSAPLAVHILLLQEIYTEPLS